ncbi:MAG: hypothetical protein Q9M09_00930 [Mariprofundaceae bacterium]|nr:hypothetical protein [Mariprofundaceae bacterium]
MMKLNPYPYMVRFFIGCIIVTCTLASCSKSNVPTEIYDDYKALDAPKILYGCTNEYPYVLACALEGTLTPEACMDDAVQNDRLAEEVNFTRYSADSTQGNLYSYQEMLDLAEAKCMGVFEIIKEEQ